MKLSLGVLNVPYQDGQKTTGDVAEILEDKYGIMEEFAELHTVDIADAITDSLEGAMESLLMGAPLDANVLGAAEAKIEDHFRYFITSKAIEGEGINGVPTKAALKGVNHRLKTKKGSRRPSFVDTGLYVTSFKAEFKE